MGEARRLVILDEWSGKFMINNEIYTPLAHKLAQKSQDLKHIPVPAILFIENLEGSGKDRNKLKYAQISKLPEKWQDILKQTTGRNFCYLVEVFKKNIENMTWAQVVLVIYRELRKIDTDGELKAYDIEEFGEIAYNVGTDWDSKNRLVPNLLEVDGNWDLMRQPRLFEDDMTIRRVK
ncbi:putative metallopeptidase [Pelosinus sp. sgz500959]|uniref:putative metallopeptidase n=1 Tax=Pelosinus sp. sgz500959 TaxID=3242472 RepID=UPI0036732080